jgi:hypothetical protein
MSVVLFVVGAIAVMVGVGMVSFGIPINEFSFGNTLIVAGTTATIGGLIVIGLGAAVAQLHRIAEMLAVRAPPRTGRPLESVGAMPETPMAPPADTGEHPAQSFAPTLRNPEAPPLTVEEEVSLSPQPSSSSALAEFAEPRRPAPPHEPVYEPPNFDAMWPAKPEQPPVSAAPEPAPPAPPPSPPRAVAILKSGVIDGMGYTLYVDGSIEAELPQGTLPFASIDELRAHLEKGS